MLLSFFPFPAGHPVAAPGTILIEKVQCQWTSCTAFSEVSTSSLTIMSDVTNKASGLVSPISRCISSVTYPISQAQVVSESEVINRWRGKSLAWGSWGKRVVWLMNDQGQECRKKDD